MNAGKLVILGMLAVTLALAGFAVWYRQHAGRRTRDYFGLEHGQRILRAPHAELLRLDPPRERIETPLSGDWLPVGKAPGILHVRGALLEDRSFDWSPAGGCTGRWQYVMRFRDEAGATSLALDLTCERLRLLDGGGELSFAPMATFLRRFVSSQYAQQRRPAGP